ncbi:MAG: hypothetical protein AMS21_02100 [Gemmatimonas sp. SG8_38_2]|nr:MAG: hypothetical protein AMS21_02100 [Gemmatimonas sp. SG8_38_2]
MATLKANGWEVARMHRHVTTVLGEAHQTLSFRSNGWILEKVDTTFADTGNLVKGNWKRRWRVKGVRGKGPALLDTKMPESDPRRQKAAATLNKIRNAAKRWIDSSIDVAERGGNATQFRVTGGLMKIEEDRNGAA